MCEKLCAYCGKPLGETYRTRKYHPECSILAEKAQKKAYYEEHKEHFAELRKKNIARKKAEDKQIKIKQSESGSGNAIISISKICKRAKALGVSYGYYVARTEHHV